MKLIVTDTKNTCQVNYYNLVFEGSWDYMMSKFIKRNKSSVDILSRINKVSKLSYLLKNSAQMEIIEL